MGSGRPPWAAGEYYYITRSRTERTKNVDRTQPAVGLGLESESNNFDRNRSGIREFFSGIRNLQNAGIGIKMCLESCITDLHHHLFVTLYVMVDFQELVYDL